MNTIESNRYFLIHLNKAKN